MHPTSQKYFRLLDEKISDQKIAELTSRWNRIASIKEEINWPELMKTPADAPLYPEVQKLKAEIDEIRMAPSNTLYTEEGWEGSPYQDQVVDPSRSNWHAADQLVNQWISQGEHPTSEKILDINQMLRAGVNANGHQTTGSVRSKDFEGSFVGIHPEDIPAALKEFDLWYGEAEKSMQAPELAMQALRRIVSIHPFPDANGRTARLVCDWILEERGYPPVAFRQEKPQTMQEVQFAHGKGGALDALIRFPDDKKDVPTDLAAERTTLAIEQSLSFIREKLRGKITPQTEILFLRDDTIIPDQVQALLRAKVNQINELTANAEHPEKIQLWLDRPGTSVRWNQNIFLIQMKSLKEVDHFKVDFAHEYSHTIFEKSIPDQVKKKSEEDRVYKQANVTAYDELFADVVAVVSEKNPRAMYDSIAKNSGPLAATGRDFTQSVTLRNWNESEHHMLFGPTRRFLWKWYLSKEKNEAQMPALIGSIQKIFYQELLRNIDQRSLNPVTANRDLIKALLNGLQNFK